MRKSLNANNFLLYLPDIIRWFARVLAILLIVFMFLFTLDAGSLLGWLIHTIPILFLIAALYFSWRFPCYGGIAFLVLAMLATVFFDLYMSLAAFLSVGLPVYLIGVLFIGEYFLRKKRGKKT